MIQFPRESEIGYFDFFCNKLLELNKWELPPVRHLVEWDLAKFSQHFVHSLDTVKTHFKKCYCNVSQSIPETFSQTFSKETFHKSYEKVSKRFLRKDFLWNWKFKKIFPKLCKIISQKVIRKPFKNISGVIAWNFLAKFLQHFWNGVHIQSWKTISRNVTAKFLKPFPKLLSEKSSKETFHENYEKISKRFLGKIFLWNRKCKKILLIPCKNISRKVRRKPFKNFFWIMAWNVLAKFSQCFVYGLDTLKTHFKKCYCKALQ